MSFPSCNCKLFKQGSLINKKAIFYNSPIYYNSLTERISKFIRLRASMTVEAAMVLPMFLFANIYLLSFIMSLSTYVEVDNAITNAALKTSGYAYVYRQVEQTAGIDESMVTDIAEWSISNAYIKNRIVDEVGEEHLNNSIINNGSSGLSLLASSYFDDDDIIDIIVNYEDELLFSNMWGNNLKVIQRARLRAYTGYSGEVNDTGEEDIDEYVYVTETGTVYHRTKSCTHIALSIEEIEYDILEQTRNKYNEKYYPCEKCALYGSLHRVYITDTGNRYHSSLGCSGLKRTVYRVKLEEVIDELRPCSRCGGGD